MQSLSKDTLYLWRLKFENMSWQNWEENELPMEKKFCEIRILGVCTAVDNFAHPSLRRHGNQNMKSLPTDAFFSVKSATLKSTKTRNKNVLQKKIEPTNSVRVRF